MPLQDAIHYAADPATGAGQDLYAVVMSTEGPDSGKIWNHVDTDFEACDPLKWDGTISEYDVPLTEGVPGLYAASLPADLVCPGQNYDIVIYSRAGATPDIDADTMVTTAMHETGDASLNLWAEAPQDCVLLGESVTFTAYLEDEDGQVAPDSGNLSVSTVGAGSTASIQLGANPGLFTIIYNSAGAIAGAQIQVIIQATKSYGTGDDCTVTKTIVVPVKVCSDVSDGFVVISKG